jgi:hypothetical protein
MGRHVEPLTGGLTTDRDPAQLNKGQLSYIRNMVYKQGATSIKTAPGRAALTTAATANGGVYGLRDLQFDNGMHYLLAGVEDMYRVYDINNGGTFSTVITGMASGRNIETVQFRNRYYVLNGATAESTAIDTNQVIYLSATSTATAPSYRQHGMLPVLAAPTITTASGGAFTQPVTGYYEYWVTEVAKFEQDGAKFELESAFSSDSGGTTVSILATSTVPTIQLPVARNANATHWRIYRSPKKDTLTAKKFPVGYLAGEFSISSSLTGFADSTAWTASASSYPTAFNVTSTFDSLYTDFSSASSMQSDNGVYASANGSLTGTRSQGSYGFNFGSPQGPIRGIKIEIQSYVSSGTGPVPLDVTVGPRSTNSNGFIGTHGITTQGGGIRFGRAGTKSTLISSTSSAAPSTVTVGSESDTWLQSDLTPFVDTEFDGYFMVVLTIPRGTAKLGIDYIKAYVYYGGGTESQVVYPTVVYEAGGAAAQVGRNFPPPSANTGDVINETLVLNDMSNRSMIRYSYPGEPDYFPPTYYLDFETKANDVVQCIRAVNNRLIVGLDNQLWRVNYLPSERDASFDRGKAIDNISGQYGIVSPMCATTITIEGQSETLAFVSNFGLHTTDGYNIITRSKCLTWQYSGKFATPIALLNDTENRCLRIYYRDSDDPDRELCLWASYDRADIDAEGNFKFSGPVSMANYVSANNYGKLESAWNVIKSDGSSRFYMGYSSATAGGAGKVYQEDPDGLGSIPGYTSTYKYKTRRMYLNGLGSEWMVDDVYGYCGTYTGTPLLTYTFEGTKTNQTPAANNPMTKSITLGGQVLHRLSPKMSVESLQITTEMTYPFAVDYGQESIIIGSKNLGYEDSGL